MRTSIFPRMTSGITSSSVKPLCHTGHHPHSSLYSFHALVTSCIVDYCHAILAGLPNMLAQISSTSLLIQLHCLPVHQRIHDKLLLLAFRDLHNLVPPSVRPSPSLFLLFCPSPHSHSALWAPEPPAALHHDLFRSAYQT